MKKFVMALFALVLAVTVASAGVGITWTVTYGAYDHSALDVTGGTGALLDSYSAIWQLIYAGADNTINAPSPTSPNYVTGDDSMWAERTIALGGGTAPEDGTTWDNWMLYSGGTAAYEDLTWNTSGFVYQRVFEAPVSVGSYYYDSSLVAFDGTFTGGGQPLQDFPIDTPTAGFQPDAQVVPEPATMGLLGLGALVMAIRRRRK